MGRGFAQPSFTGAAGGHSREQLWHYGSSSPLLDPCAAAARALKSAAFQHMSPSVDFPGLVKKGQAVRMVALEQQAWGEDPTFHPAMWMYTGTSLCPSSNRHVSSILVGGSLIGDLIRHACI